MIGRCSATVANVLLIVLLAAAPAHALLCGDGILDQLLLEECDDGNNVSGDCCSAFCQLESPDTVCRASSGACDPAETCTGLSAACPADVVIPDGDGDAVCDPSDLCPSVSDPLQTDLDADGIGDACDPCVDPDANAFQRPRLALGKLDLPAGNNRVRLKGFLKLPSPVIDPVANGLQVLITDGNGTVIVSASIPPGEFEPQTRTGWRPNRNGTVFSFRSRSDAPELGGIQRVILKTIPFQGGIVRVLVIGRTGTYETPQEAPVTMIVNLDPETPGQCGEAQFNAFEGGPRCTALNNGARFICK